ncbi:molybdopterin-dependent oxidoreductase alpha subunit [Palleronia aestuarii]|uniref:Molybdopterin-dependent oxidoreductase alpha subunit n=1 Tax=Palleronia aestuarii TaxID=568105 RepID=A0A2W7N245_9RHOB|nr:FdhF/YdeP family oxidoreductase [Palleronia aestuarii]PZX14495.1 molybdopterin-dependent oxidoreductase alpha subunit [Palleronia aestuarii]
MSDIDDLPLKSGPAGGWGSLSGMKQVMRTSRPEAGFLDTLRRQNKPGGFMCSSCAWPKPPNYRAFEFCENGAKHTMWENTSHRCTPAFWDDHTVTELRDWSDHDLEMTGRLTAPLRFDAESDRYVETSWEEAIDGIAAILKNLSPEEVVFYASGHAALEASYLYGLLARLYGTNNLPQSSNMCHETTSVGLKEVIGSPVGTVIWEDIAKTDCFFFFGQNPGTNSPRFLHPLKEAKDRGVRIVTFNPLREQGLVSFISPQDPVAMATGKETIISDQYHQLRAGGDVAAILGLCKAVIEADDAAQEAGRPRILDVAFIEEHTTGFDTFIETCRNTSWSDITREAGLTEGALREAADVYMTSERVIGVYGMGLTQHSRGALNIAMLVNLMLLRGNIGRPGAGMCPVRGHSNVQGQRTVGIAEKAELIPNDRLKTLFDFDPPLEDGTHIVDAVEGLFTKKIKAFLCLGGNLLRAVPEQKRMEEAWAGQEMSVMVSTKLNRSHLFPAGHAWILPCLGRAEIDEQATGPQAVSIEDSFSMIHGSTGHRKPPSPLLKSEMAIVCALGKALIPDNPKLRWDEWTGDYGLVRDLIERTYPDDFAEYNNRLFTPGGFWRENPAHKRIWETESGKAVFTDPDQLNSISFEDAEGRYRLITLRSNDQFNTTIYGYSDRFRGIEGTRDVVLMNEEDMAAAGYVKGDRVALVSDAGDEETRRLGGLAVIPYQIPRGTLAGYYPECNVLISIKHHDQLSKTPASKSIPVRIEKDA